MNKIKAILYGFVLILALISRVFECTFEAILQAGFNPSCFIEAYRFHWTDQRYFTPVETHWNRVKELLK